MRTVILILLYALSLPCFAGQLQNLRIDGRTPESTRRSIQAIEAALPAEKRTSFERAIEKIRINNPKAGYDQIMKGPSVMIDDDLLGKRINGMTYNEILKLGGQ